MHDSFMLLLVGTSKGGFIYHGDAARDNWKLSGPFLPGWEISAIHREPSGRLLAGTTHFAYGATFRASEDGGETWRELPGRPEYSKASGRSVKRIWQIAASPTDPKTLFCGVDEAGLFITRDGGESWREMRGLTGGDEVSHWFPGAGGLCLHTILIDPKNPQRLWVGISAVGVFRSLDGGESWSKCNAGLPDMPTGDPVVPSVCCVHKMVLDPKNGDTIFMQFHGGVFRTDNAGDLWRSIESGLPGNFGFPMVISKTGELFITPLQGDDKRFFRDGKFAVYRSRDGGTSWQACANGLPSEPQFVSVLRDAMAADAHDPAGVYLGTTMGEVWQTRDAGDSWNRLPGMLGRIEVVRAYHED